MILAAAKSRRQNKNSTIGRGCFGRLMSPFELVSAGSRVARLVSRSFQRAYQPQYRQFNRTVDLGAVEEAHKIVYAADMLQNRA